ncbi:MAG: hypothetical protein ACE5HV_18355 [Acidobacteriota bacterium]
MRTTSTTTLSARIMTLFAGLLLAVAACSPGEVSDGAEVTGDLLDHLPAPASFLAWADFDAMRASPLSATLIEDEHLFDGNRQEMREMIEATGIDPVDDLHALAVASLVVDGDHIQPVLLATVDFEQERLLSALQESPTLEYRAYTLYEIDHPTRKAEGKEEGASAEAGEANPSPTQDEEATDEQQPAEHGYLVIFNAETLLLGSEQGVKAAIDVAAGDRSSVTADESLGDLLASVPADSQAWVVATDRTWSGELKEWMSEGDNLPVPQKALQGIKQATFSMRIDEGVNVQLSGLVASEEDARLLRDSLQGLLAMGKLMVQSQRPELFDILDRSVRIDSEERRVRLDATLDGDDLETLRKLAESRYGEKEG